MPKASFFSESCKNRGVPRGTGPKRGILSSRTISKYLLCLERVATACGVGPSFGAQRVAREVQDRMRVGTLKASFRLAFVQDAVRRKITALATEITHFGAPHAPCTVASRSWCLNLRVTLGNVYASFSYPNQQEYNQDNPKLSAK